MLTMRAMDENGRWLPKTKTAYVLDENGERNRQIKHVNTLIRSLQKAIAALDEWIKTVAIPCFLLIAPFPLKTFLFPMDKYGTFFTNKE